MLEIQSRGVWRKGRIQKIFDRSKQRETRQENFSNEV